MRLINLSGQIINTFYKNKSDNESFSLDISFVKSFDIKFQIQDEKVRYIFYEYIIITAFFVK